MTTEGVIPDYQKDPNTYQKNLERVRKMTGGGPGAGGPESREAIALERIADTLDNIAALLASQRVPAGSSTRASGDGTDNGQEGYVLEGDDGGWIGWSGGERPVPPAAIVDVEFRGGYRWHRERASILAWGRINSASDIIAYRIHKPQEGKTE